MGAEVPCAAEQLTRSHAHRCSCLTHQHGDGQSGLVTLTFDFLTLTAVSESRVTWATSVPILVFLGLSVLDLGPMYATDRQTDRQTSDKHHRLMPPPRGRGIIIPWTSTAKEKSPKINCVKITSGSNLHNIRAATFLRGCRKSDTLIKSQDAVSHYQPTY